MISEDSAVEAIYIHNDLYLNLSFPGYAKTQANKSDENLKIYKSHSNGAEK